MLCAVAVSLILLCCIVLHQHANCKITTLGLSSNNIGADGALAIANAIAVCSVAIRLLCPLLISVVVPLQRNPTIETLYWDHKLAPLLKGTLSAELHDADDKAILVYLRSIRHSSVVVNRATLLFVGYASCFGSVLSLFFLFGHLTRCSLPSLSPLL